MYDVALAPSPAGRCARAPLLLVSASSHFRLLAGSVKMSNVIFGSIYRGSHCFLTGRMRVAGIRSAHAERLVAQPVNAGAVCADWQWWAN
jgi:hypothetical protein